MAMFVSNKDETVPLFKNPVLEYFTHIQWWVPVVVFLPAIGYFAYSGFLGATSWWMTTLAWIGGVFFWTFTEYAIHRWPFHYQPKTEFGNKIHFMVHGVHHDYPRDSTRLVMPLLVSIPLATLFYFAFSMVLGVYCDIVFSGFLFGYLAYDVLHYATHHWPMPGKTMKFLKQYHMRHHFQDDNVAYGITSPLWDYVFRSVPDYMKKTKVPDEN